LGFYGMLPNAQKKSPDPYKEAELIRAGNIRKADPENLYRLT
jgi:sigma-54-specific transcriptional regulator